MLSYTIPEVVQCRTAVVPVCDADVDPAAALAAIATFQLRLRDQLDFSIDFTDWLERNGGTLETANFTVAAGSPQSPVIIGQSFSPGGKCVVVLKANTGAAASHAYWMDLTVEIAAVVATEPNDAPIAIRKLVRRFNVVVVNG